MKKTELKEKLEDFYNWQNANLGTFVETLHLVEGIWVNVEYETTYVYGDYEFYVVNAVGFDDKADAIIGFLYGSHFHESDAIQSRMREYLSDLCAQAATLHKELRGSELDLDFDDLSEKYETFEDLWKDAEEYLQNEEIVVKLTKQYDAVIKKDVQTVTVGCQEIHIDQIREVVEAFDELNDE